MSCRAERLQEWTRWVSGGEELPPEGIEEAAELLLNPEVADAGKAELLLALRAKGETPSEISHFVRVFLRYAHRPELQRDGNPLLDVCGTGGDGAGLFNVSTCVSLVCAACGARVVKHGNRGITSRSGGADVLEALGVPIDTPPELAGEILAECGFIFLFAPLYHPSFAAVAPTRKRLAAEGKTTIFNILGPLLNPALPEFQLAGVFRPDLLDVYAEVFRLLGRRRAWAVHGQIAGGGCLDELSISGPSLVRAVEDGQIESFEIDAQTTGIPLSRVDCLSGGDSGDNARILLGLLDGTDVGPRKEIVALNAAAALVVGGLAEDLAGGLLASREALANGAALAVLEKVRNCSWRARARG